MPESTTASEAMDDFHHRSLNQWQKALVGLFGVATPTSAEWEDMQDIKSVLQHVGRAEYSNHTFLPTGGGQDLSGAAAAAETGCLELHFAGGDIVHIAKPSRLSFVQSIGHMEWAYFRLELAPLPPSGVYDSEYYSEEVSREHLTEIEPGEYLDHSYWEVGSCESDEDGNDIPLPETARFITRHFGGSFVIFAKRSPYNLDTGTYDGRHNDVSAEEFRDYITKNALKHAVRSGHVK